MTFKIGNDVVKPGLGICKIKAIRKMQIEGKEQSFYVLHSGEVSVMVPFSHAHAGGLRPLLDEDGMEKIIALLREPIRIPEDEYESLDHYKVNIPQAKDEIKHRNPETVATLLKTLFYKSKLIELDKSESDLLQDALIVLAEEYAHLNHTTRQKAMLHLRATLKEGRQSRKQQSLKP